MVDDPFSGFGLRSVELADQNELVPYLASLSQPLSDYTFSQLYSWRNSLRILWKRIDAHLCVFANGTGDLTLLMPPIGDTGSDRALRQAFAMMDEYNSAAGVPERSRVEYASDELLARFDCAHFVLEPMGADYVYDTRQMIDLAGGAFKSKRQERNRFTRDHIHRIERYDGGAHREKCQALLAKWKAQQDANHHAAKPLDAAKRQKESLATELALEFSPELGLVGMVVFVTDGAGVESIAGFTFGEALGKDQSSIVIEKTDLRIKGLAQFIFSEFCRMHWSDRPFTNVGDDWGLETLRWTKLSYNPVKLLGKYVIRPNRPASVCVKPATNEPAWLATSLELKTRAQATPDPLAVDLTVTSLLAANAPTIPAALVDSPDMKGAEGLRGESAAANESIVRFAREGDLDAAVALEKRCFSRFCLSKRQLRYLHRRASSVFVVAECQGEIIGQAIALVRQHKKGLSGRVYSLAVDDRHRGKHLGEKLLTQALDELRRRGAARIYLEVEANNAVAIHLYERAGFRPIGQLPDYYGPGNPGLHMMYELPVRDLSRARS